MRRFLGTGLVFLLCIVAICGYNYYKKSHPRILLTINSYEKPIFVSAQVLRLMNQTYKNFKLNVSVKGMDDIPAYKTFFSEWQPFIKSGHLGITRNPEKTVLSDWLDTVRSEDLNQYDIICMVKDENWYAPDYLSVLANHVNPKKHLYVAISPLLKTVWSTPTIKTYTTQMVHGNGNVCLSPAIVEKLKFFEQNKTKLKTFLPKAYHEHLDSVSPAVIAYYWALKTRQAFVLTAKHPLIIEDENIPVYQSF